jgi:6-pyruvoyltetrahydropterin/6-carboxytetrahydropterin synthase
VSETGAHTAHLTRRVMIRSMHALGNPQLSDTENLRIFGKCYKTHGHHYYVEATVEGEIDRKSGLCCDRDRFDDVLQNEIVTRFDGVHLNDFFKSTSGEDLAREFFVILKKALAPVSLVSVRVHETAKNVFTHKR